MPVSRRTGKRYAKGSQATFGNAPRDCHGCGGRLVMKRDSIWFETLQSGEQRSWHTACRPTPFAFPQMRYPGGPRVT